jgi:hypothetical protein
MAIELVAIILVAHILFNGVINVNMYIVIIIPVIFLNIYFWEKVKQRGLLMLPIALQLIFLVTLPIIFWLFKPEYTFLQAKNAVTQNTEFLNGFKVQDTRNVNMKMFKSSNPFVSYAYFIEISNDEGIGKYIVFNPISGEYKFFIK